MGRGIVGAVWKADCRCGLFFRGHAPPAQGFDKHQEPNHSRTGSTFGLSRVGNGPPA
jgi:hypothetical protein